jgi:hypothetical protein
VIVDETEKVVKEIYEKTPFTKDSRVSVRKPPNRYLGRCQGRRRGIHLETFAPNSSYSRP